jgi:hypothetical protein
MVPILRVTHKRRVALFLSAIPNLYVSDYQPALVPYVSRGVS